MKLHPGIKSLLLLFIAALFSGCGAPLTVEYRPLNTGPRPIPSKEITIEVKPLKDLRASANPRAIGSINATVADMTAAELILDKDVSELVTAAFTEEFKAAGFKIAGENADFILSGEIKEFKLDIGVRDEIKIALNITLTDNKTGKAVWSGAQAGEGSRYAGVMGNSRETISRYITSTLSGVVKKSIAEAAPATGAGIVIVPPRSATAGETTSRGRLLVTSDPPRAKFYIGDVYYGLTPVTLELSSGIYEVRLKLEGYKDENEKVGVRENTTTELDVKFK